jgi:hypothetical protein
MQPATFGVLATTAWDVSQRHWRFVVIAMLALLHVAVFRGVADPWARALLLAHLGLLLLWQPFLRAEQRVSAAQGFILALVAFAVMLALDWWLLAFWVVVLAGLVGGKVYQHDARWQRRCYLVVLVYLLALLAVVILPEISPRREIAPEIRAGAEFVLPLAFVLIALFPAEPESTEAAQVIDFFYGIFIMLLLVVVILGSFTFMSIGRMAYLKALTYTVFVTATAVLLIGLAWSPRGGFAGLNVFFARYMFSIGLPGADVAPAADDLANGLDELFGGTFFVEVTGGAGLKQTDRKLLLGVHAEHQHRQLGLFAAQLLEDVETRPAGHGDVEHHDVVVLAARAVEGFRSAGGLTGHLHVGRLHEDLAQALAHYGVIVRNQNLYHRCASICRDRGGHWRAGPPGAPRKDDACTAPTCRALTPE